MQLKNQLINLLLIGLATIAVGLLVIFYCDVFYDLDLLAKVRLLENPWSVFFVTPALFWVSSYLCRKFARNAAGFSLEHIKSALQELKKDPKHPQKISPFLSFRIALVSILSSLISSFGGGALGREGPSFHIAASIFAGLANKLKNKIPQIDLQNWIFVGSAVGLAAAFNAPLAGLVYVIEKVSKNKYYHFGSNIILALVAMIIFMICLQQPEPLFKVADLNFAIDGQIMLTIFIAAICGLLAFLFKKISNYFYDKFVNIKSKYWHLIPILAGLAVAFISSYCGIYSFSGGIKTASDVLVSSEILLSYKEVIGRILNTIITFASGCAGGLVAPAITIGAGIASIISSFFIGVESKILILIGMSSFLAVIIGEPFTAAIIIYESTNQEPSSLSFLVLATTVAIAVAKLLKFLNKKIITKC